MVFSIRFIHLFQLAAQSYEAFQKLLQVTIAMSLSPDFLNIFLKFCKLFLVLFSNKILVINSGIHKMLVRIANREYPDYTAPKQSDLVLHNLSRPFWQATSVRNVTTFTIPYLLLLLKCQQTYFEQSIALNMKILCFLEKVLQSTM